MNILLKDEDRIRPIDAAQLRTELALRWPVETCQTLVRDGETDMIMLTFDGDEPGEADILSVLRAHVPLPPVPSRVTMAQARIALAEAGIDVDAAIATLDVGTRRRAALAWEYAAEVSRDGDLVALLAGRLGLGSEQIDDLFRAAAAIRL